MMVIMQIRSEWSQMMITHSNCWLWQAYKMEAYERNRWSGCCFYLLWQSFFFFFFLPFLPTKSDYVTYFLKAADRFTLTEQIPGTLTYLLSCRPWEKQLLTRKNQFSRKRKVRAACSESSLVHLFFMKKVFYWTAW